MGFHAQRAVKKALEAVLIYHGIRYPFTHDIAVLIELCEGIQLDLGVVATADELSAFAGHLRYDAPASGTIDRAVALAYAEAAVALADSLVGT